MADSIEKVPEPPLVSKDNFPPVEEWDFQIKSLFGRDLAPKDVGGKSDPYVLIGFIGDEDVALDKKKGADEDGGIFYKSEVTKASLSFSLHAPIMKETKKLRNFKIEIWDKDALSADDWMGSYVVKTDEVFNEWFAGRTKWTLLNDCDTTINGRQVQQGVKSGKVKGSISMCLKVSHPKIAEYAKVEADFLIYQNKVRQAEAAEKKRIEKEKAEKEAKEKEEKRRIAKEKREKEEAERKAKQLEELPGAFAAVVDTQTFIKFADRSTFQRSWFWDGAEWDSFNGGLSKKEAYEAIEPKEFFRVLSFALVDDDDFKLDLFYCAVGFVHGLCDIVDFTEWEDFSKLLGKIYHRVSNMPSCNCVPQVEKIIQKTRKGMNADENWKNLQTFIENQVFSAAEKEAISHGFQKKQQWDTDTEPINRLGYIVFKHKDNWKPEHAKLLKDLMVYIRKQAISNMGNSDYWDCVARYCMQLESAKHSGIDECMKNRDSFLVVDGIGVNFRVLHIFKKKLMPMKTIYQPRGRWHFPQAKDYTRGGWQYING